MQSATKPIDNRTEQKTHSCEACSSSRLMQLANLNGARIIKCLNCSFVYLDGRDPRPQADYYDEVLLDDYIKYYKDHRTGVFSKHLRIIEKYSAKGKILDIGCSFGWFLDLAQKAGWVVFGLENSQKAIGYAREKYGLSISHGGIESVKNFNTDFQVITLWNVLEHIPNPLRNLEMINEKLSSDGLLVISVPNIEGLITKLAFLSYRLSGGKFKFALSRLYQIENENPHLYHFSLKTITSILNKSGYKIVAVFKENIIDAKNISSRLAIDSGIKDRNVIYKSLLAWGIKLIFYLSKFLRMEDEIIVYSKKNKVFSSR